MAEIPAGYRDIPEEDRKKAELFFERGRTVAATGNYEYGIEMYLSGLKIDPEAIGAHQTLRDMSLKRKASGGKAMSFFEARKLRGASKEDKENLLNAEKLLAYDPGNTDHMLSIAQNAYRAGFWDTCLWIAPILLRANADAPKPELSKFLALRDIAAGLKRWKLASDACQYALRLRPNDMDLATDVKNYAAMQTMEGAGYDKGGSFREQVKDMRGQLRLLDSDKEVSESEVLNRMIADAETDMKAEPNEPGKAMKLVDLLIKTENPQQEERAMEILRQWFQKTGQYKFRQRIGQIQIRQMVREERVRRKAVADHPQDEQIRTDYEAFHKQQLEFELAEMKEWANAYPTDMAIRYEIGRRQYVMHQYDDAVTSFQLSRNDPKFRVDSVILLGRTFLENGFIDEADDTLGTLIRDYPQREGQKYKEMNYWRGRTLEQKGDLEEAIKCYSIVFMVDSNYVDVGARMKRLREELKKRNLGG